MINYRPSSERSLQAHQRIDSEHNIRLDNPPSTKQQRPVILHGTKENKKPPFTSLPLAKPFTSPSPPLSSLSNILSFSLASTPQQDSKPTESTNEQIRRIFDPRLSLSLEGRKRRKRRPVGAEEEETVCDTETVEDVVTKFELIRFEGDSDECRLEIVGTRGHDLGGVVEDT